MQLQSSGREALNSMQVTLLSVFVLAEASGSLVHSRLSGHEALDTSEISRQRSEGDEMEREQKSAARRCPKMMDFDSFTVSICKGAALLSGVAEL